MTVADNLTIGRFRAQSTRYCEVLSVRRQQAAAIFALTHQRGDCATNGTPTQMVCFFSQQCDGKSKFLSNAITVSLCSQRVDGRPNFTPLARCRVPRADTSDNSCFVFGHARQQTFTKAATQNNRGFARAWIVAQGDECSFGRSRIAFGQRAIEPATGGPGNGVRPLREDCINRLVERPGVRFPVEFKSCTSSPQSLPPCKTPAEAPGWPESAIPEGPFE